MVSVREHLQSIAFLFLNWLVTLLGKKNIFNLLNWIIVTWARMTTSTMCSTNTNQMSALFMWIIGLHKLNEHY